MVRSYTFYWENVSSMIISPTFGWKKVSSSHCLIVLGDITRLITKTHTNSTRFGTGFIILRFGMKIGLVIGLV